MSRVDSILCGSINGVFTWFTSLGTALSSPIPNWAGCISTLIVDQPRFPKPVSDQDRVLVSR